MNTRQPIIRTRNLHRDFVMGGQTVRALDGVDMTIQNGDFMAVLGPSGSGKSTLLHLLGGLDRPTAGEIWVNQDNITQLDENDLANYRGQRVGFVFQAFYLIPTMSALQNVEFPMIFERVSPALRRGRARDLLERVGLGNRMTHKPIELSGGQQQRVAIARALANDPQIVLADEPTGNLDTQTGAEVLELLKQLNEEEGRTVVIVSHDSRVMDYATRAIHLLDGRVVDHSV
jgi:putative ABC transport system ATP-binding protein